MRREDLTDPHAFLAVAEERSFTRDPAGPVVVHPEPSIGGFEERLGVRLLNRTTRSVAPTEAGERLLEATGPRLDTVATELAALGDLRGRPAGAVRITTGAHACRTILWPMLRRLPPEHPDVHVEVVIEHRLTDQGLQPRLRARGHSRSALAEEAAGAGAGRLVPAGPGASPSPPKPQANGAGLRCWSMPCATGGAQKERKDRDVCEGKGPSASILVLGCQEWPVERLDPVSATSRCS